MQKNDPDIHLVKEEEGLFIIYGEVYQIHRHIMITKPDEDGIVTICTQYKKAKGVL